MATTLSKRVAAVGGVLIACTATLALADAVPAKAELCIPVHQIQHTKILDDENILFYVNNNKAYQNHLPHPCNGLASAGTFEYRTSQSELCNVDIITVLNLIGSSFTRGPSCGLGQFEPVDGKAVEKAFDEKKHKK